MSKLLLKIGKTGETPNMPIIAVGDPYDNPPLEIHMPPRMPLPGDQIAGVETGKSGPPWEVKDVRGNTIVCKWGEKSTVTFPLDQWGKMWRFHDDPLVRYETLRERQVLAVKVSRALFAAERTYEYGTDPIPPCPDCQSWPCLELDGCYDFLANAVGAVEAARIRADRLKPKKEKKPSKRKAAA